MLSRPGPDYCRASSVIAPVCFKASHRSCKVRTRYHFSRFASRLDLEICRNLSLRSSRCNCMVSSTHAAVCASCVPCGIINCLCPSQVEVLGSFCVCWFVVVAKSLLARACKPLHNTCTRIVSSRCAFVFVDDMTSRSGRKLAFVT